LGVWFKLYGGRQIFIYRATTRLKSREQHLALKHAYTCWVKSIGYQLTKLKLQI